jgi:serpin B
MAASAAHGDTRVAILKVLGLDPNADADTQAKETIARLTQSDPNTQLELAQSVWAQDGLALNPAYVARLRDDYQAQLANLDFSAPNAPTVVNGWVDSRTHGMIKKLVDQFDPGTVGYLVNATYFHALWAAPFTTMPTPIKFYDFGGGTSSPPSMFRHDDVIVDWRREFLAALIPYAGGRFSAVVIMPQKVLSRSSMARFITLALWSQALEDFRAAIGDALNSTCKSALGITCDGNLQIPKFTLDYHMDVTDTLNRMGMPIPAPTPDFCSGCSIDNVVQATRLEVDEKGTTAAAATGVGEVLAARPGLTVDHPFVFAIVDNATGAPLFLGVIGNLS